MAVAEAIGALGQTKKSEHQHITKTLGEAHHKAEEQAKDRGRDGAPDGRVAPKRAVWVPLPALVKKRHTENATAAPSGSVGSAAADCHPALQHDLKVVRVRVELRNTGKSTTNLV